MLEEQMKEKQQLQIAAVKSETDDNQDSTNQESSADTRFNGDFGSPSKLEEKE